LTRRAASFLGVIGWPLEHTLSPAIQNVALRRLGLDWVYLAFPVPPDSLGAAITGLRALGALGANVTMPFKESVVGFLDELSGDARSIGVVNTIQRVGDAFIGHNTDVDGFAEFVSGDAGVDVTGSDCLVLGAGGAARAVVKALEGLGASEVAVAARNPDKATSVTAVLPHAKLVDWPRSSADLKDFRLVVNATPLGLAGEDALPDVTFSPGQVIVDLIYDPPTTPILERARAGGALGWSGLGMLVRQAAASLRIWTGQDPPLEAMSAAALHALGRR
jgi:shikimate dehydrogenase